MKATDSKPDLKGYSCNLCNYNTPHKNQYVRHLLSDKHTNRVNSNGKIQHSCANGCDCGKPHN